MENLYEKNGLIFWNQEEIKLRRMFDLEGFKVIEVAIGTDRCIYNFLNK